MKSFFYAFLILVGSAGMAAASPDFNQSGPGGDISGAQMRSVVAFNVDAGGDNYIWDCPNVRPGTDRGAGYFTTRPDFTFRLWACGGFSWL